jgi:hypothetical protein
VLFPFVHIVCVFVIFLCYCVPYVIPFTIITDVRSI